MADWEGHATTGGLRQASSFIPELILLGFKCDASQTCGELEMTTECMNARAHAQ